MEDEIVEFAYKLFNCGIITQEEYNKVVEVVVNDRLDDIKQLIDE